VTNIYAYWSDTTGQARTTTVSVDVGIAGRPVIILLHGASGSAADMVSPMSGPHAGELFDAHGPVPAVVDRGWHNYPNAGWWSLGALDPPASGQGWAPFLGSLGFPIVVYSQVDPTGLLANPVLEFHGVMDAVRNAFPGRGYAIVADSRGGLLARRWLADLDPAGSERAELRAVATLHTPHQGTGLATQANTITAALNAVVTKFPSVAGPARQLASQISTPDLIDMAPGSPLLTSLSADEAAKGIPGSVKMHTWGGTSPRLVRARNWAFTADSAVPQVVSVIPPKVHFHWRTVPQELVALADGVNALGAIAPEFAIGGDLLVTEPNTKLSWSTTHTSNPFSHADTLINPTLQQQVAAVLAPLAA
jgi:hypothetical protein